jgi:hypothetical protein
MLVVEVCAQFDQQLDKGQRAPLYCIFERMIPDRQLERLMTVGKIPRIIQRLPQCINVPRAIRVVRSLVLARDLERVSGHIGNLAASLNARDRDHAVGMVQKQITVWRIGQLSARAPQPVTTAFRNALAVDGAALVDLGWNIPKKHKGAGRKFIDQGRHRHGARRRDGRGQRRPAPQAEEALAQMEE